VTDNSTSLDLCRTIRMPKTFTTRLKSETHSLLAERKRLLLLLSCLCLLWLWPLEQLFAQTSGPVISEEDVQFTPVNTPVVYRWYRSNSEYQYWYISGGSGTINPNTQYTNGYMATVTWNRTGFGRITYVTRTGVEHSVSVCRLPREVGQ
jgi:hypothetical protein